MFLIFSHAASHSRCPACGRVGQGYRLARAFLFILGVIDGLQIFCHGARGNFGVRPINWVIFIYRARSQPELRPTPRGSVYVDLAAQGEKLRERRINHIDTRLRVADHQLRLDRLRVTTKGHTKARFNAKAQTRNTEHER